jgi:cytochrome c-type biogenesis protein CcmH/NrfF
MTDQDDRVRADSQKTLRIGIVLFVALFAVILAVRWLRDHPGKRDAARSAACAHAPGRQFGDSEEAQRQREEEEWRHCTQCCGQELAELDSHVCSCWVQ